MPVILTFDQCSQLQKLIWNYGWNYLYGVIISNKWDIEYAWKILGTSWMSNVFLHLTGKEKVCDKCHKN